MEHYVEFRDLPVYLQQAVSDCGRKGGSVAVAVSETFTAYAGGDGQRGVAVCVNLDTGRRSDLEVGSWGGANPFEHRAVDRIKPHAVPPRCAVVAGSAGGRGVFVSIYLHPDAAAPVLPPQGPELTPTQQRVLDAHCVYNSAGRKDYFRRHPVEDLELTKAELAALGLLKVARNGAAQVTAAGRNARKSHHGVVRGE